MKYILEGEEGEGDEGGAQEEEKERIEDKESSNKVYSSIYN